ncbi:MAG: proline--tRNA ligase [Gemmatimonadota bacterium]
MSDEGLTPQSRDFAAWYNEVVREAELASHAPVRGCMVIRPYAYRIWELMQEDLDRRFKETGHQNAYFPLFLEESALRREAEHVEGFAPETAVVTEGGGTELEERLVVRPTSEAVIWPIAADWIQSYRDLPMLLNQWANVVRWELRTRPFLRTTEFLWQEGHTAHATAEEAREETLRMLGVYRDFMTGKMAMPVLTGPKTASERFAGAEETYTTEALMKDNRALQAGTSHYLGRNFARAFGVRYQTEDGEHDWVHNTSWGVSTRLIGALIMAHGDDDGLVLPPELAPHQVVVVPIWTDDDERSLVLEAAGRVRNVLSGDVRVHVDDRETVSPGAKFYEWERKGVPLRIEIGPREVADQRIVVVRRFTPEDGDRKRTLSESEAFAAVPRILDRFQRDLLRDAERRREENSLRGVEDWDTFRRRLGEVGGFVYGGWCGSEACEQRAKDETSATIRVLPDEEFRTPEAPTSCAVCGEGARAEAVWARAY